MSTDAQVEAATDAIIKCSAFADVTNNPRACARDMAIAALAAAQAAGAEWQPIETAPKRHVPAISHYDYGGPSIWLWCGPILGAVKGHWEAGSWWYTCHSGRILNGEPTHWLPLDTLPDPTIRALRPPSCASEDKPAAATESEVIYHSQTSRPANNKTSPLPASAPAGAPSEEDVARAAEITAQDREYAADLIDDIEEEINDRAAQIEIAAQWLRKNRHEAVLALLRGSPNERPAQE